MDTANTTSRAGLGETAYQKIRNDIVWCILQPGEEVSEARLAEKYGLGKTPIRQALLRLGQEGFVTPKPRRGHMISLVTLKSVRDLFDLRLVIETAIVERASGRVDRARLEEFDRACLAGYTPGDRASEARFLAANNAFHNEIARASGNQRLQGVMESIFDEMTRMLHLGFVLRERPKEFISEHQQLIDALVAGETEAAVEMTRTHIDSVHKLTMDGIINFSTLNSANIAPV